MKTKFIELTANNGEKIYLPVDRIVVIKRPVGRVMVGTVDGSWKWAVDESYESIKTMLDEK